MRYVATRAYRSGLCTVYHTGPLAKGTEVDLEPAAAAAFNADSDGILLPFADKPAPAVATLDPAGEAPEAGEGHRQVLAARDRALKPARAQNR